MSKADTLGMPRSYICAIAFYCACPRRCLTHIINLATQAVITTHSKSKFYDGSLDNDDLPEDLGATERDKIGIVRAICVKVRPLHF
jgi:hypothetical protein